MRRCLLNITKCAAVSITYHSLKCSTNWTIVSNNATFNELCWECSRYAISSKNIFGTELLCQEKPSGRLTAAQNKLWETVSHPWSFHSLTFADRTVSTFTWSWYLSLQNTKGKQRIKQSSNCYTITKITVPLHGQVTFIHKHIQYIHTVHMHTSVQIVHWFRHVTRLYVCNTLCMSL